jgi:hypothetical protein
LEGCGRAVIIPDSNGILNEADAYTYHYRKHWIGAGAATTWSSPSVS